MKKIIPLATVSFFMHVFICSATTVVLRPDGCEGKDALNASVSNTNYGNIPDLEVYASSQFGSLNINRSYIAFNLSSIPAQSTIINAQLCLYYNNTNSFSLTHYGNNSFTVYRIISPWSENLVNWTNQPAIDNVNFKYVPASTSGTQNYTIDVTSMMQDMVNDPSNSYGFNLRLNDENPSTYNVVICASSDHPDTNLHPMLVVDFLPPAFVSGCHLQLQPGAAASKDAIIDSVLANSNFGDSTELDAYSLIQSGIPDIKRSCIAFDISSIPTSIASITNATLSLFYNSTNSGSLMHSGNNAFSIYRITTNWDEHNLTWNNQPNIDNSIAVHVPAATSGTQNFVIDVTSLVQEMIYDPLHSFGFYIRMDDESTGNSVLFASGENSVCNLHPILDVTYSSASGINKPFATNENLSIFPNPANDKISIKFNFTPDESIDILITDVSDRIVFEKRKIFEKQVDIDNINLKPGIYFFSAFHGRVFLGCMNFVVE